MTSTERRQGRGLRYNTWTQKYSLINLCSSSQRLRQSRFREGDMEQQKPEGHTAHSSQQQRKRKLWGMGRSAKQNQGVTERGKQLETDRSHKHHHQGGGSKSAEQNLPPVGLPRGPTAARTEGAKHTHEKKRLKKFLQSKLTLPTFSGWRSDKEPDPNDFPPYIPLDQRARRRMVSTEMSKAQIAPLMAENKSSPTAHIYIPPNQKAHRQIISTEMSKAQIAPLMAGGESSHTAHKLEVARPNELDDWTNPVYVYLPNYKPRIKGTIVWTFKNGDTVTMGQTDKCAEHPRGACITYTFASTEKRETSARLLLFDVENLYDKAVDGEDVAGRIIAWCYHPSFPKKSQNIKQKIYLRDRNKNEDDDADAVTISLEGRSRKQ